MICRAAVVAAALLSAIQAAAARDLEVVKNKYIETELSVDDVIAKEAALLADVKREGLRWTAKWRRDAETDGKDEAEIRAGRRWTAERHYRVEAVVADRYVSVARSDSFYTLGAHPNSDYDTILWDRHDRKRISLRPFFIEMADDGPTMTALAAAIRGGVAAQKKERGLEPNEMFDLGKAIQPKLTKIGALSLVPSTEPGKSAGLSIFYPAYAVGSYAEGPYDAFVPWTAFAQYLSPLGRRIFGGEQRDPETTAK